MTRGRRLEPLELNSEALDELKSFAGSRSLPHGLVRRAKIVLLSHEGLNNTAIAKQLSITRATVGTWRERYRQQGLIGLYDELRPGKPRSIADEEIAELLRRTLETKPVGGTHWSCRSLAILGDRDGYLEVHRSACLVCVRSSASPTEALQIIDGSVLRRQGSRYRRTVSQSTRQCDGAMRRREKSGASA